MRPRILDVVMTDQDYEALRKKLLETYSVRPTLPNPTVKRLVDWHCLESSCFLDKMVFDVRERWMRHHQRFHNRMCDSHKGYPKEIEAKQFIQEHERRENARQGIAGAGGSVGLLPPTETPAGPYSRISGAVPAIPLNSAAPSSSTSGALRGASPSSAAPNSPRSEALRNSVAARRSGPSGPYRQRANKVAPPQEHPDQSFVNIAGAGALQIEPESSGTLDAAQREILMQRLSQNLQAVSRINEDSMHIMEILGLSSTTSVSEIRPSAGSKRPRESPAQGYPATTVATPVPLPTWVVDRRALASSSRRASGLPIQAGQSNFVGAASQAPAHLNVGPAHVFESTPYPSQAPAPAPAHSNVLGPAHVFEATPYPSQAPAHSSQHPRQELALAIGRPAHSYKGPPLSIERGAHPHQAAALSIGRPAHSYEGPPHSIERRAHPHQAAPAHLALTYMTPSQPEEKEDEENHNAASDSEREDPHSDADIYQAVDVSHDVNQGQMEWTDVKVEL